MITLLFFDSIRRIGKEMKLMGKEVDLRSLTVHFIVFFLYLISNVIYIVFALLVSAKEADLRSN